MLCWKENVKPAGGFHSYFASWHGKNDGTSAERSREQARKNEEIRARAESRSHKQQARERERAYQRQQQNQRQQRGSRGSTWPCGGSPSGAQKCAATDWAALGKKSVISLRDVNFPDRSILLKTAGDKAEYRKLLLTWHPDKFIQKYGTKIKESEKERMMEQVTKTFQTLQSVRSSDGNRFGFMQQGWG